MVRMTLVIMTLAIMTLAIMTLVIMTPFRIIFRRMALGIIKLA